ncbi:MAG: hypothetical protein Q9166_007623 [cf. Caloplaca sp. 2 TL-2023]
MARRTNINISDEENSTSEVPGTSTRQSSQRVDHHPLSPSPAASFSSDKENRPTTIRGSRSVNGKSKRMPPPKLPTPASAESSTPRSAKRRRLGERDAPNASQVAHDNELDKLGHTQYYDPNQSMAERRAVRKGIRDLSKELTESRAEYLTPASNGLVKTLQRANEIFATVRQTSDATLDSRLLVSTADLSAKRTTQLNLGDNTQGIDIDDFIGKCITFMRRGPNDASAGGAATQNAPTARQRRRRDTDDEDSSLDQPGFDEGDEFNWAWLGSRACFPHNLRPPMPSFLLGPLAVQKKLRKQTQRRERLQKCDPKDAIRPEEIKAKDLEQAENSNLSTLCKNIHKLLMEKTWEGQQALNEVSLAGGTDEEYKAAAQRHGVTENGQMSFFPFVINPKSFGQTVENLFYVSFLIRDGDVQVGQSDELLPTLIPLERASRDEQAKGTQKHQAVFHLDFDTWEDLIDAFDIKHSIIPHRLSEEEPQVNASGWYT